MRPERSALRLKLIITAVAILAEIFVYLVRISPYIPLQMKKTREISWNVGNANASERASPKKNEVTLT